MLPGIIRVFINEEELTRDWGKYGHGYHLGDVIAFGNDRFSINGDTIIQKGQRVAIIARKSRGMFGNDNEIEIASLDGRQSGVDHQK